jgi:hypothetical protein
VLALKKATLIIPIVIFLIFIYACSFSSVLKPNNDMNTKIFISEELHVSLSFDKKLRPPSSSCATGGGKTIDEFVKFYYESMNLLGTNPKITSLKIDNQPAILIIPSNDQPIGSSNEAFLIVKYPPHIVIKGIEHANGTMALCDFFTLSADKNNIMEIAKTIEFK